MSKNIKKILKEKMNHLFETKGFEDMEVAFGVKDKSDNLDSEEAGQFGPMETVEDYFDKISKKGTKLGEPSVQPALTKVHKEDKKDADDYYKEVAKRMVGFQKTDESEPTQIGESDMGRVASVVAKSGARGKDVTKMSLEEFYKEMYPNEDSSELTKEQQAMVKNAYESLKKVNQMGKSAGRSVRGESVNEEFDSPKVDRKDDQTEPEDVYDTEALGTGMQALKYDNEGTEVHDKFEERMEDLNDGDATYEKLKKYSEKYLKHKYEDPDEYHYTPKVRATDKAIKSEGYSDIGKENIFKVKGTIKNKKQIIKLVDKLPSRVRVDETVFSITDGQNSYRLVWEGAEDGEVIVTHEKNVSIVNESINKMRHLWEFKSSDSTTTKKNITESSDESFKRMFNKLKGK